MQRERKGVWDGSPVPHLMADGREARQKHALQCGWLRVLRSRTGLHRAIRWVPNSPMGGSCKLGYATDITQLSSTCTQP
eukprot:6202658-Pleurochrysis_carterae.AAC.2